MRKKPIKPATKEIHGIKPPTKSQRPSAPPMSKFNSKTRHYRKKPIVVEAIQYKGISSFEDLRKFMGEILYAKTRFKPASEQLIIPTLEGDMKVKVGDYIVKGIQGEFYPCKPNIFEQTYEPVSDDELHFVESK